MDIQANALIKRMQQDMRQALRDKERNKLDELRSLLARVSNAEAVSLVDVTPENQTSGMAEGVGSTEAQRKQLTLAEVRSIIIAEAHEIESTLRGIDEASDYATQLREKLAVVRQYL